MTAVSLNLPVLSTLLDVWLLAVVARVLDAVVRILLCALAIYSTRKALTYTGHGKADNAIRCHQMTVLRTVLTALARSSGRRHK